MTWPASPRFAHNPSACIRTTFMYYSLGHICRRGGAQTNFCLLCWGTNWASS